MEETVVNVDRVVGSCSCCSVNDVRYLRHSWRGTGRCQRRLFDFVPLIHKVVHGFHEIWETSRLWTAEELTKFC